MRYNKHIRNKVNITQGTCKDIHVSALFVGRLSTSKLPVISTLDARRVPAPRARSVVPPSVPKIKISGLPKSSPTPKPRASLLHRAPRIGLSRLHRVPSIHEITIIEEEE